MYFFKLYKINNNSSQMKFKKLKSILLLLLTLLLFSTSTTSRKFRRNTPVNNLYYRFYWGIITRLIGKDEKNMSQCLPSSWLNKNPEKDDVANVVASLTAVQAVISKIIIILTKHVDNACKDKALLQKYIIKKTGFTPKKKIRRIFMRIARKYQSMKGFDRKKIHPFNQIVRYFKDLKFAISGFFTLPIVKASLPIFKCVADKFPQAKGVKDLVSDFLVKVDKIAADNNETIGILIDSLCSWHRFRRSIHFLNAAFKQNNALTRWQGFGYFLGRLASTI